MQNSGGPGPDQTRNVIIALALSLAIFLGFDLFYNAPLRAKMQERAQAEETLRQQQQAQQPGAAPQ